MADVRILLTRAQARAVIDALDMRTEGTQGDMTAREVQAARTARARMASALRSADFRGGEAISDFVDASGYSVRDRQVFDHRGDKVFVSTSIYNLLVRYGMALETAGDEPSSADSGEAGA